MFADVIMVCLNMADVLIMRTFHLAIVQGVHFSQCQAPPCVFLTVLTDIIRKQDVHSVYTLCIQIMYGLCFLDHWTMHQKT